MALIDFIPFQCVSIYLDDKLLLPVDPEVSYIVFFLSMDRELIKLFCRKNPNDDVPVYPKEITIPWSCIKDVTLIEKDEESQVIIEFTKKCEFNVCELNLREDVFRNLEATLDIMLIRVHVAYGRSEKEARESVKVLSTVEDSDFGLEEDMIKSASSSSSAIIPSSYQTIEDSQEILAPASEENQKTVDCTPYIVEDTPPATQDDLQSNIIPCTPAEPEIPVIHQRPVRNFHIFEDILGTQESQDANLEIFDRSETASERAISPLSEGDFGGIVVPETDYEDTQSNCSDSELDDYVEKTLSNLKNIADASQEKDDFAKASQEENCIENATQVSQQREDVPVSAKKINVISVNKIKGPVYYDYLHDYPNPNASCSAKQAIEMISKSPIILLNGPINKQASPEKNDAFGFEEIQETPKSTFRQSRRISVIELNDFIEVSNEVVSDKNDCNNNESQAIQRMLQEDEDSRNIGNEKTSHLIEFIDDLSSIVSNKENNQIEETPKQPEVLSENKGKKGRKGNITPKKKYQKKLGATQNTRKIDEVSSESEAENKASTKESLKATKDVKNDEKPKKKKLKTTENTQEDDDSLSQHEVDNKLSKTSRKQLFKALAEISATLKQNEDKLKAKRTKDNVETKKQKGRGRKQKNEDTVQQFEKPTENIVQQIEETIENNVEQIEEPTENNVEQIEEPTENNLPEIEDPTENNLQQIEKPTEANVQEIEEPNEATQQIDNQTEDNVQQIEEPPENLRQDQNKMVETSNEPTLNEEINNNEKENLSEEVPRKIKTPVVTPSRDRKKSLPNLRKSKKRYPNSDSDEWTPYGIIKHKKLRRSVENLEDDEEPPKESFFSSYSRTTTLTKTRTRIVTRSNRFGDELKYYSEAEGRRKRVSSSSRDTDDSDDDDDDIKTVIKRRNSTNVPPDYNETPNTNCSDKPKESIIIIDRSQSTPSTSSVISSVPKTPRRRLSHTPKFALNNEPNARKCPLPFSFVENEDEFMKSFRDNLSQTTLGAQSEPEDITELETEDITEAESEVEAETTTKVAKKQVGCEMAGKSPSDREPVAPASPKQNGDANQNSHSSDEQIPATEPSKRPYKPFLVFTSESSPESPKPNITEKKNTSPKRETNKTKGVHVNTSYKRRKANPSTPKRPVPKNKKIQLSPLIPPGLFSPAEINDINFESFLDISDVSDFSDDSDSQEDDIYIALRKKQIKKLLHKLNKLMYKQLSEKQFYSLTIQVFSLCLKCINKLNDLKQLLLISFNRVYCNNLKLSFIK